MHYREGENGSLIQLQLWEACDKVLSCQFSLSNQEILHGCWKVWTVVNEHLEERGKQPTAWLIGSRSFQAFLNSTAQRERGLITDRQQEKRDIQEKLDKQAKQEKLGEAIDAEKQLWRALQNTDADSAKVIVEQLEVGKVIP